MVTGTRNITAPLAAFQCKGMKKLGPSVSTALLEHFSMSLMRCANLARKDLISRKKDNFLVLSVPATHPLK